MEWGCWRIVTVTGWVQVDYPIVVIALEAEGQSEWGQKRLQPQCDYLRTPNSLSRLSSSSFKIPISFLSCLFLLTSLNHHPSPFSSSTLLHRSLSLFAIRRIDAERLPQNSCEGAVAPFWLCLSIFWRHLHFVKNSLALSSLLPPFYLLWSCCFR